MLNRLVPFVCLALLTVPLAASAQAQQTAPAANTTAISMDRARQIATENGVATIEEIELDDGKWEVDGRDSSGREIDLDINAQTGAVVKVDRD